MMNEALGDTVTKLILLTSIFAGMAIYSIVLMKNDGDDNENK